MARRAWVSFSGYDSGVKVFSTVDGGTTWINISRGLPNLPVNAVAAKKGPAGAVYVGLDSGVYYRDDRLGRRVPFLDGLPNVVVTTLLIDELRGRLIAGTFGRGVWLSDIHSPCTENCASPHANAASENRSHPEPAAIPPLRGSYAGPAEIFE
jgi:hypothetical protein